MAALAPRSWLTQALGLMPTPLHKALDAWSYGLRRSGRSSAVWQPGPRTQAAAVDYKLRPWRD